MEERKMADKSMDGLNSFTAVAENTVDTTKKLRVGIIGCGWIAASHIKAYLNQPDVELVAGCDLIPGKAAAFFEKYGVEGVKTDYASHKEMLDDESLKLDAVSICTYNRQHAAPAIYALNKGINVLLEKPFTVTLDEAVEVMKAEKASGKILSIGFQPRLDANMKMIKKIVDSGELGKIYYIQTGGGRRRGIPTPYGTTFIEEDTAGIGALGDIGCYSLDMVLNAIGYPKPLTVSGYKSAFFGTDPNYCGYRADKRAEYANKFYEMRKAKGMTQEVIAEKMNISPQAVSKWENDLSAPDVSLLLPLAELLGVTADTLLGKEDPAPTRILAEKKDIDKMVLRILINDGGDNVKINLPVALVRVCLETGIQPTVTSGNSAIAHLDFNRIFELVEQGIVGELINIDSDDGSNVRIFVE